MKKDKALVSTFISDSEVDTFHNRLFSRFIKVLFRNMCFDSESSVTLEKYSRKGHIVFASFQSSNTSLLILSNILRKTGHPSPLCAPGYRPSAASKISSRLKRFFQLIKRIADSESLINEKDSDYLFYQVNSGNPLVLSITSRKLFFRRWMMNVPDTLEYLLEIQNKTDRPIYVLPQIIFWNRNPEKTRGFVASKATGDRGLLSALITVLKSATEPFVRLSDPIDLQLFMKGNKDKTPEEAAAILRHKLYEIQHDEKRTILGPVIKPRNEIMETVLSHSDIMDAITSIYKSTGTSEKRLKKKAYRHFREISSDFSIVAVNFFDKLLSFVFKKIFTGIEYDIAQLAEIRSASRKGPLVIVSSHKSHMDYLIISSIFFKEKLVPPHIMAGSNLSFFPLGMLFRKSGAFFVRRSFKDNLLYSAVLKQYVKTLVAEGYSIEFFIEGGRSRTGSVLFPKIGAVKYITEAVDQGYSNDLVFIPTAINYDRVPEEKSYRHEIKGFEKEKESVSGFVKSRNILKRVYGKVYVSFGEPVTLSSFSDHAENGRADIGDIALSLTRKICESMPISPTGVAATALLSMPGNAVSEEYFRQHLVDIIEFFKITDCPFPSKNSTGLTARAESTLEIFQDDGILRFYPEGASYEALNTERLILLNPEERGSINYYSNTVIHHLLPLAFTALALLKESSTGTGSSQSLLEAYIRLKELFHCEFVYTSTMSDDYLIYTQTLNFLKSLSVISFQTADDLPSVEDVFKLRCFAGIVEKYICSYYIVMKTIETSPKKNIEKALIENCVNTGIKLYHLSRVNISESISVPVFRNAVRYLADTGLIRLENHEIKESIVILTDRDAIYSLKEWLYNLINILDINVLRYFYSDSFNKVSSEGYQKDKSLH